MKKYTFALIAVVFALASAFAFKPTFATFRFDGASTDPDDRVDPQMYTLASPSCGSVETTLCTISAANDGSNKPVIDEEDTPALYEALWNDNLSVPDFSHAAIVGKNP